MHSLIDALSSKNFIPHGFCLSWSPVLLWLHVGSDLLITLSYYSIPLTIIYFLRQRQDVPYPWLISLFAGFILACGTTHLLSVITVWIPLYWQDGLLKALTALLSIVAALAMLWIVPRMLSLPSAAQLQAVIEQKIMAETALQESEFRWKFALESSGDGMWDRNLETDEVNYSSSWKKMLGYSENDILPCHQEWLNRIHPDDKPQVSVALQAYLEKKTENYAVEFRLRCKDDSYKWVLSRGKVVNCDPYGKPLRMIGTHKDISERKRAENELLKYCSIFEVTPISMMRYDSKLNITFLNAEFVQTFGYNLASIPTLPDWWLKVCPDPGYLHAVQAGCQAAIEKARLEGVKYVPFEVNVRCLDNSVKSVQVSTVALQDYAGETLVIINDITRQKQREARDKEHLNALAHVMRLGLMGEMASGLAHELNQPLTAISSYAQACINFINAEQPDLAKLAKTLTKTREQALRAGQIIYRIRGFVKSEAKIRAHADVNALVYESANLCMADIEQNSINLTFNLEKNLPAVFVDYIQIEQVIINLIRNSIDALSHSPENQPRLLTVSSCLTAGNLVQVSVKDNGMGLNKAQQEKILTPFYTTKEHGMGMGLSISHSLIEDHHGCLGFTSESGEGSNFYFTLPAPASRPAGSV